VTAKGLWVRRAAFAAFAALILTLPSWLLDGPSDLKKWAEWLCYASICIGIDLSWGYGGMLVLGQGVFFGLGAYCAAMHLQLADLDGAAMPNFMQLYSDFDQLPLMWRPFHSIVFTIAAGVLLPMILAAVLGLLVFRRRVRGPFFALLMQATTLVFTLILIGNLPYTAGFNGLEVRRLFDRSVREPDVRLWLYRAAAILMLVVLAAVLALVRTRFGRLLVAIRDGEERVRFLGYNPATVKTIVFTISAAVAGAAGMIAAPILGIVVPSAFGIVPSILLVCWVAIGGRGTLWGAAIGALVVNWFGDRVSASRPDDWQYVQGALFVVVLAFAPGGLFGIVRTLSGRLHDLPQHVREGNELVRSWLRRGPRPNVLELPELGPGSDAS